MSALTKAREFLEREQPGLFERMVGDVLGAGGIMHAEPDCFLLAMPEVDEPGVVRILFQCSELPALRRVIGSLGCHTVVWRRDLGGRGGYGERRRAVKDFWRHRSFGLNVKMED